MAIRLPLLLLMLLALTACAQAPVTGERHYLLPSARLAAQQQPLALRLQVAGYLDQAGLVLETGPATLTSARSHRWAEPLEEQLKRSLAAALPKTDGELRVTVSRFQGTTDGDARVSGEWRFQGTGGPPVGGTFDKRQALERDGYEELVLRLDAAWMEAAGDIARRLAALMHDARVENSGDRDDRD
ncbi:membrane integrity-associated transporter subunit PqiC [Alloalcanivorax sp. C16-2]|uniref:PqiC family protein n=1 Tax=Alloalcanivorax sp. C16-2 TaxID=3390052 RepID=UPI003970A3C1